MSKKVSILVILFVFFISIATACTSNSPSAKDESGILEFNHIPWNSSPEYVINSLNLPEEKLEWEENTYENYKTLSIGIANWEIFGENSVNTVFRFKCWGNYSGGYGLDTIEIYFPDSNEHGSALKDITNVYGDYANYYTSYDLLISEIRESTVYSGDEIMYWVSTHTFDSYLSDNAKMELHKELCEQEVSPLSQEDYEKYLKNHAVIMYWMENAFQNLETPPSGMTRDFLIFQGTELVMLLQRFGNT